ncbi:MAG TPA: hypothetical protein VMT18_09445 [Planctomycetota bacterium]|nr:hypothetical protein [Planctomycetota bacterium]
MSQRLHRALATAGAAALLLAPTSFAQGSRGEMPPPGVPSTPGAAEQGPLVRPGQRVPESAIGPVVIETMEQVLARQAVAGPDGVSPKARNGAQGEWEVPSLRSTQSAHSGTRHVINRWGDTNLGLGFPDQVDVQGAWLAGQGTLGSWTTGVQVVGFRDGVEVGRTGWFETIEAEPTWFEIGLQDVDRVEFHARAVIEGSGWYALDDLTYLAESGAAVVLDFEDLDYHTRLTDSGYGGLVWERGTGSFQMSGVEAPKPQTAPDADLGQQVATDPPLKLGGSGTTPSLKSQFIGPKFGDAGANLIPPDTCGAVGMTHFLSGTNANFSVFVKSTGQRIMNVSTNTFWGAGGTIGDPRVAYDPHHDRWAVLASNFNSRVYFAYSLTGDPTGAWLKTFVNTSSGSDAGKWPDYPTLGLDANGVYFAAYQVGGSNQMTIWSIDKAPMLSGSPTMGTVNTWPLLPWEGAIQPCVTYGNPGGVYLVSRSGSTTLRLRQITGNLTSPSLIEKGFVTVPSHSSPPDAPQQGTNASLDTIDFRPMNAVFRNGHVWTTQCINVGGRAAVRWYQINVANNQASQVGTISDPVISYFMPGIAVNGADQMMIGFTGSSPSQFAGAYLTGRVPTDASGETGPPLLYKAGEAPYTQLSSSGSNRWGDYSLTSVDPVDDSTLWTIQQYARVGNSWVTQIASGDFGCQTTTYCTAKVSSNLCVPSIAATGTASLSNASGFVVTTTGMEPTQTGLDIFGTAGQAALPFQGGILCIGGQVNRLSGQNTGGGAVCTGSLTYTLTDVLLHPSGGSVSAGSNVYIQSWGRDTGDAFGSSLSDALEVIVCP